MVLGALIDAGVSLEGVKDALGGLAIAADTVWTERVSRAGISATRFCVRGEEAKVEHGLHERRHEHVGEHTHGRAHTHHAGHSHEHAPKARAVATLAHSDVHRSLADIGQLIDSSGLSPVARSRAKDLFQRLGETEAAIHGTPLELVHLHEVGALDSVIDIVGAVYAIEALRISRIASSPLNLGSGTISSAHGHYPVPAPATLRLLQGVPVYAGPQQSELVTPTGALLVSSYATSYGVVPPMRVTRVGYGAGSRDFPDRPNVLRVLLGEEDARAEAQTVVVVEAEIDDMNPQIFGVLMDGLLGDGALDVFYTPIQMKKNRPGTLLTVVCRPEDRDKHTTRIFRETTTIGVRYREMTRECLDRETVRVTTPYGPVTVKVASRHGEVLNAAPEFDDCLRVAREAGKPVKDIQAAATKAFLDQRR